MGGWGGLGAGGLGGEPGGLGWLGGLRGLGLSNFAVARVLGLGPYQECGARSVNMPRCHSGIQCQLNWRQLGGNKERRCFAVRKLLPEVGPELPS